MTDAERIPVASIWLDKPTGRRIRILQSCIHGTGPAWTYLDGTEGNWHYCCAEYFTIWGRFERVV